MKPEIHSSSYIAKSAVIIGRVTIGKHCGVFPCAVIRGDQNHIDIDDGSNVQDCCVIHCDRDHSVTIGKNVSIGHGAIIHGSIIEDNCLIGINATILNGATVGQGSIVGANALVTTDMQIPPHSLVLGVPAKIIKQDPSYEETARRNASTYQELSKRHKEGNFPFFSP
jgi:carbonic anhydrase/acetyltransferase-like protein (isoleucine patch superfamily)